MHGALSWVTSTEKEKKESKINHKDNYEMISASRSVLCALWQAVHSSKMQAGKYSVCVQQLEVECLPRGRCFSRKNSRCLLALIYKVEVVTIIKELYIANSKRTMAALFAVLIAWTKRNDQT